MAINIYDVARLSGVSIATVSRVVNGSTKVSEKTRQKVMDVMDEYGYTPNVFARGLGLNSMKTIGILCPNISDIFVSQAVSYLEERLNQYHYDCILSCSGYEQEQKEEHAKMLLSKRIDALILISSTFAGRDGHPEDVEFIQEAAGQIPVFMINGYVEGENIYCSFCNDYQATYNVTKAFLDEGRKNILFLSDSNSYSAIRKLMGYEAALKDAGCQVKEELKLYAASRIHLVRDLLLERDDLKFDSVVAVNDFLAIGVIKYAKERQLRIPEDISITGYNNSPMAVGCEPELTSVDNHLEQMCDETIANMFRVLQGEEDVPEKSSLECTLKQRCTTNFS